MGCVSPLVNDLQVFPLQEVAGTWLPCQHNGGHFPDDLFLFPIRHRREPLLQAQLPLATEEQQEAHLMAQTQSGSKSYYICMVNEETRTGSKTHTHTHIRDYYLKVNSKGNY